MRIFGREQITVERFESDLEPVMVGADMLELLVSTEWEIMDAAEITKLTSQCPALERNSSGITDATPYFVAKNVTPSEVVGWIADAI